MPKFDNVVRPDAVQHDLSVLDSAAVSVDAASAVQVFYAVYRHAAQVAHGVDHRGSLTCTQCVSSALVTVHAVADADGTVIDSPLLSLTFAMDRAYAINRSEPKCVRWSTVERDWSRTHCAMTALNDSHVVCRCSRAGTFAVLLRAHHAAADVRVYVRVCTVAACAVILLCALLSLCLRHRRPALSTAAVVQSLLLVVTLAHCLAYLFVDALVMYKVSADFNILHKFSYLDLCVFSNFFAARIQI